MRNVIEVDCYERKTFVSLWDDLTELTTAVRARVARTKGRPIYGKLAVVGGLTEGVDYVGNNFSPVFTPRYVKRWLGRTDLTSWDKVLDAVHEQWADGVALFEKVKAQLDAEKVPEPRSIKRKQAWSEVEGDFDWDRYYGGEGDFWRGTAKREWAGQQFVTIFVRIGGNCDEGASRLTWRGVVAAVLCEMLERNGYSVELLTADYGINAVHAKGDKVVRSCLLQSVWLKRAEEDFDQNAVVNATSPWFFRLVNFASYHLVPQCQPSRGYGTESDAPERLLRILSADSFDDKVVVYIDGEVHTVEAAAKFISSVVEKINLPGEAVLS